MERAVVVYNPVAGSGRAVAVAERAAAALERNGLVVERAATVAVEGAAGVARRCADETDLLVVIGGDGSLRQAIVGLGERAADVTIGLVPMGNANLVARELAIPLAPDEAIAMLGTGVPRTIDVGTLDGQAFVAVIGAGWDALAVRFLDRVRHTRIGRIWYRLWADSMYVAVGGLALVWGVPPRLRLTVDDAPLERDFRAAILSTCRNYGKGWWMTPEARIGSGRIHYQARKRAFPLFAIWHVLAAMLHRSSPAFVSDYGSGTRFAVESDRPFPVQADGDFVGYRRRIEIELRTAAARILAPAQGSGSAGEASGTASV